MASTVIAASAATAAIGSISAGQAAKETAQKQAYAAQYKAAGTSQIKAEVADLDFFHAEHALEQAGLTKELGDLRMLLETRKARAAESTMLARQGKTGATVLTGSARESLADVIFQNEVALAGDRLGISQEIWEKGFAAETYKRQGMITLDEAKLGVSVTDLGAEITREEGEAAAVGGLFRAAGDIGAGYKSILSLKK